MAERKSGKKSKKPMDDQTEFVFRSIRSNDVDPVSGNEVPPGSLPEEVRDDIDARLSEGEYVVPADVVRYYGVKFFEDLRNKAKSGLEQMDKEGRIGGEPAGMEVVEPEDDFPFDISELRTTEDIQGFDEGGDVTKMKDPFTNSMDSGPDFRTYVNEQGLTLYIRFVDGKPMDYIPPGYTLEGESTEATTTTSMDQDRDDRQDDPSIPETPTESTGKSAKERLSAMSLDDLTSAAEFTQKLRKPGVSIAAGSLNPLLGLAVRLGSGARIADIDEELRSRLDDPNLTDEQISQIETARSQFSYVDKDGDGKPDSGQKLFGGYRSTYEGLKDTDGDGDIDFGDTWLGDLLGFDGKAGVQGAGLSESRGGARRHASIKESDIEERVRTASNLAEQARKSPDATAKSVAEAEALERAEKERRDSFKNERDNLGSSSAGQGVGGFGGGGGGGIYPGGR